jgi:hypothetical protein
MEQMLEHLAKMEAWTMARMDSNQDKMEARMDANERKMDADKEIMARIEAKMNSNHERMMAKMDAWL